MSDLQANKALVRFLIEEGVNRGNLAIADEHFASDYVVHIPRRGDLPAGPRAFKQIIGMWRDAFPDFHMTVEQLVAEGEFVANRFTTRGTHEAPLLGIPATGKSIVIHGQELHRLVDGKVAETWVCDDLPSMLVQLGVLPAAPARQSVQNTVPPHRG